MLEQANFIAMQRAISVFADISGALHHIIARGRERRRIFDDDEDRHDFVRRLALILEET